MQYRSTRGPLDKNLNAPQAIIKGLADDGGLLVPHQISFFIFTDRKLT